MTAVVNGMVKATVNAPCQVEDAPASGAFVRGDHVHVKLMIIAGVAAFTVVGSSVPAMAGPAVLHSAPSRAKRAGLCPAHGG
jgi:hypothetical protein